MGLGLGLNGEMSWERSKPAGQFWLTIVHEQAAENNLGSLRLGELHGVRSGTCFPGKEARTCSGTSQEKTARFHL